MLRAGCAFALLFVLGCLHEDLPGPVMTVELSEPVPVGDNRYVVVGQIGNFDPDKEVRVEITVGSEDGTRPDVTATIGPLLRSQFEFATDQLDPSTRYHVKIRVVPDRGGYDPRAELRWWTLSSDAYPPHDGPTVTGISAAVADATQLRVYGQGLGIYDQMWIGYRPGRFTTMHRTYLYDFKCDVTGCNGVLPVLTSPPLDQPQPFDGALPAAVVYLQRAADPSSVEVGITQLAYRVSPPRPSAGPAGSVLEVDLFHPARAPDLTGLIVRFDGIALAPLAVRELVQATAGGESYSTRAQFRVPDDAAPGVHHVGAITTYSQTFLSINDAFVVVAP